jgi:glycerol kinase
MKKRQKYIVAIDQGTTSTRFILFNENGEIIASHQLEHKQIFPKPGWVEHNPLEIWDNTVVVIRKTLEKSGIAANQISGIGITNQRETVVAWDPKTGKPYYNAIVWQDIRGTSFIDGLIEEMGINGLREKTGLTLSPYFAGSKIRWMLDNVEGLSEKASQGNVMFGTMDTWLIWNLSGGTSNGIFITDFTNASRYQLMDLKNLCWDKDLLALYTIPEISLPEIKPSMGMIYGYADTKILEGGRVPLCGILGDQQSALFGQACFSEGMAKNTYGTGCFLLVNTGEKLYTSTQGLLTTAAYHKAGEPPKYALEGSIAVAGSLVQWVRDNLGLVKTAPELDVLAESVEDNGGVYFVPAFSGLFAPYWRSDARGVIAGLTGFANSGHIARAVLEATAYQAYDIFGAVEKDSGIKLRELRVDGGLTNSRLLMQFQSDILNIPVIRPAVKETTALGAAYAAGLSIGYWESEEELGRQWREDKRWIPGMAEQERTSLVGKWHKAVERTLNWSE